MMYTLSAVYGASGFGREVMPLALDYLKSQKLYSDNLVFIDDTMAGSTVNGFNVVSYEEFLGIEAVNKHVAIAIANGEIREELADRLESDGIAPWSLYHSNVVMLDQVDIDEGSVLCPFVTLTSNVKIGKCFHANLYSYVAHDCVIGDFVTFAPGVKCNGNVVIEDHAYIGTGAVIKQGRPGKPLVIGKGAVVGMGAVVTKNVPAGETVIGNPAKSLNRNSLRSR